MRGAKSNLVAPRFPRVYVVPADMNGLVSGRNTAPRICAFGHDDFPYKLKLLEGVSSPPTVGEGKRREGENETEIASGGRGRRGEREAGRDREREGEADQRRVVSREAGSVPFSRS